MTWSRHRSRCVRPYRSKRYRFAAVIHSTATDPLCPRPTSLSGWPGIDTRTSAPRGSFVSHTIVVPFAWAEGIGFGFAAILPVIVRDLAVRSTGQQSVVCDWL